MPPREHSRLFAPSSAKRWLSCAPSAVLSADVVDESGPEAIQGTLAHKVCENGIRSWWDQLQGRIIPSVDVSCATMYGHEYQGARVDEVMVNESQGYVDMIIDDAQQPGAMVFIEQRIDFSYRIGLPVGSAFGSADAIIWLPEQRLLRVYDFKYGKWPIEPDHNTQALCYLLAAINAYGFLFDVATCEIVIYQPRIPGRKKALRWEVSPTEVRAFGIWVYQKARKVLTAEKYYRAGGLEAIPENMFVPTDDNCQFCKAPKCPARRRLIFK